MKRQLETAFIQACTRFKGVAVIGPRQSGKTTLVRALCADRPYVSLEEPDIRDFACSDPRRFLAAYPDGAVLDEVQRVPDLLSYLQGILDAETRPGRWILTGSQSFALAPGIRQSLAGRVAILRLLPFSLGELQAAGALPPSLDAVLLTGGYPPIYDQGHEPGPWLDAYIQTYVDRDIRDLVNVRDLQLFRRFVRLCAARVGCQFNQSELGQAVGITQPTARAWFDCLETSFITLRLQSWHRNLGKRITKTPKLYFTDVGLAARLQGIRSAEQLALHPARGALFENLVVVEALKAAWHRGEDSCGWYWRDRSGTEIDLILERGEHVLPIECKSGATIASDWDTRLQQWSSGLTSDEPWLIYGGDTTQPRRTLTIAWRDMATRLGDWFRR